MRLPAQQAEIVVADKFGMLESDGRMNVLVIDDDCALLRSIEILLAGKGHRVVCFDDKAGRI